jgi:hypothetical protein
MLRWSNDAARGALIKPLIASCWRTTAHFDASRGAHLGRQMSPLRINCGHRRSRRWRQEARKM